MTHPEGNSRGNLLADRLPPQNLEAEQGVLGSILLDNDVLHEIVPILRPDDFYRDTHQIIYRTICDLYDLGKAIDYITLVEELTRRDQFKAIGGDETLSAILNSVPHAANARFYAQIVSGKAITRALNETATDMLRDGYSNNFTAEQLVEAAERRIFAIAQDQTTGATSELGELVHDAMERLEARSESRHAVSGLESGYLELDDLTSGFQPGQLALLAARPSMGKTALALNICDHVAVTKRIPVFFVSLEMTREEVTDRLLCARSRADGYKFRMGHLNAKERAAVGRARDDLRDAPLHVADEAAWNMLQITATARRLKRRQNIGLIVVDYVQMISGEERRENRQEEVARISRRLKMLAREVKVPVLALSQLNRQVENREDRRPRLADLRESGGLEQDADLVMMLHRPEVYDPDDQPGMAELILTKNRNGPIGSIRLTFLKHLARFENFTFEG